MLRPHYILMFLSSRSSRSSLGNTLWWNCMSEHPKFKIFLWPWPYPEQRSVKRKLSLHCVKIMVSLWMLPKDKHGAKWETVSTSNMSQVWFFLSASKSPFVCIKVILFIFLFVTFTPHLQKNSDWHYRNMRWRCPKALQCNIRDLPWIKPDNKIHIPVTTRCASSTTTARTRLWNSVDFRSFITALFSTRASGWA